MKGFRATTLKEELRTLLDEILAEAIAAGASPEPIDLWTEMNTRIARLNRDAPRPALSREESLKASGDLADAYHYSAKILYGARPKRKGRPRISDEDRAGILVMRDNEELTHAEIATRLGLAVKSPAEISRAKDVARKRIEAARKS